MNSATGLEGSGVVDWCPLEPLLRFELLSFSDCVLVAGTVRSWVCGVSDPAALAACHALGLEMPAFVRAAAIFCCCVISAAFAGACSGERRITCCAEGEDFCSI